MIKLKTPLTLEQLKPLKAGDQVLLTGTIFTARDAAHKRLNEEKNFPAFLRGQTIYYAGPTPAPPGHVSGSIGPTTSGRMDKYTPTLLKKSGIISLIGKGYRSADVKAAMKGRAVYFAAIGGAGALMAMRVKKNNAVLYKDLGAEAVYKLEVENMPLTVALDLRGGDVYERGIK